MGVIQILLLIWGGVTAVLICTMIYRSMLSTHEEDQIFLEVGEESMAQEQRVLVAKIEKLGRPITALAVVSGVILVTIVGMWLYQGFKSF